MMMDDSVYAGLFVSEFDDVGLELFGQPVKKQLLAPDRRPGGPRQAFRPVQNSAQHVCNETALDIQDFLDVEVIPPKHSNNNAAETDIDPSCLDALDDQLLVSPIDSFVDVCWAEAVDKHDSELGGDSPTLYSAPMFAPQKVNDYNMLDDYRDLDPLGSDNEKWYGDEINDVPVEADIRYEQGPRKLPDESTSPPTSRSLPSLAFWEPHFTIPNPNDTVHGFPSRPPKSRRRKIDLLASACSHFPARLVKSAT